MNLRALLIVATLVVFTPSPSAALPSASPPKPNKGAGCGVTTQVTAASVTAGGAISGRVYTDVKKPLANGEVWICHIPTGVGTGKAVKTATGLDGSYVFSGLDEGGYQLTFADPAGKYAYQYWNSDGRNAPSSSYASTLVLYDDKALTDINRVLPAAGWLTGKIHNKRGEGLPNVRVSVDIQDLSGLFETTPITPALTGPDGAYTIGGLPTSDRYRLTITDPEGRYHPATLKVSVTAGRISAGVDVTLPQTGGDVTGDITDLRGGPLAGILVTPYRSDRSEVWQPLPADAALTDSAGRYQLFNLPSGTYRIGFSDPSGRAVPKFYKDAPDLPSSTAIDVAAENTTGGIDAALALYSHIYLPLVIRR